MNLTAVRIACITLLALAASGPSLADSFGSSASSSVSSKSVGSSSDSIKVSSNSSSGETKVADGDYRVIEVADAQGKPGMLQLKLQALAQAEEGTELLLTLPREALVAHAAVGVGAVVNVRNRAYGIEFAHAGTANGRETFFLVLADDWRRELDPRAVTL